MLDEIETALDDANVYKFARYLKKYSNVTQFAVITHRKGTMEAADTLYGVTMQEHGVSRWFPLRWAKNKLIFYLNIIILNGGRNMGF